MAKKTTARAKSDSKAAPKAEAAELAPAAPKARPKARTAKKAATNVAESAPEATALSVPEPSDEDIRVRAYHRYLERGGGHGMDFEDWLEAKRELQRK